MKRPCTCDVVASCRLCYLWHNDRRYRRLWGGDVDKMPPRVSLPTIHPCPHEGPVIEWCNACPKTRESKHVRDCAIHERCTRVYVSDKVQSCDRCPDRVPVLPPYRTISKTRAELDAPNFRKATRYFTDTLQPFRGAKYPRGIVISGGGKYLPSVYVSVRMVRHVGCTLPIQVWHYGDEGDERYETLLRPFDVEFVNADKHEARASCRHLHKYAIKTFAALNCPFTEVLHLDADCYPVLPVEPLFSEEQYRDSGGTFWPDIEIADPWTQWRMFGVPERPKPSWETGEWLIDKRIAWKQLNLAYWYDQHAEYTWKWDLGDKGSWRAAWSYYHSHPAMYAMRPNWVGEAYLQMSPDGVTPQFVHRCRDKFRLVNSHFYTGQRTELPKVDLRLPLELEAHGYLKELEKSL